MLLFRRSFSVYILSVFWCDKTGVSDKNCTAQIWCTAIVLRLSSNSGCALKSLSTVHRSFCADFAVKCDKMWKGGKVGHTCKMPVQCENVRSLVLGRCCHSAAATGSFCHPETSLLLPPTTAFTLHTMSGRIPWVHIWCYTHAVNICYDSNSTYTYHCAQKTKFVVDTTWSCNIEEQGMRWQMEENIVRLHNSRWIQCPSSFVTRTWKKNSTNIWGGRKYGKPTQVWVHVYVCVCVL